MKTTLRSLARHLLGLGLGLVTASLASADVYFTPAGAGSADGSSWANAYPQAQLQAQANVLPSGQTLHLGSGTYTLTNLIITTSGEAGAPKRLVGEDTGGGLPFFQGPYVINSGSGAAFFRFPGAVSFWEIKNLRFNNYRYGLDMPAVGTTFDLRTDMLFENLAFDSVEDGLRIRNATRITIKNCSVIRHTKKAFRVGLYTAFMTYDGCSADCNGGDESFPSQSIPTGFGCDDTNDAPLIHDITFVDCSARNNGFAQAADEYWNGDGYSSERGTYNLTFIRCSSFDNKDGGFDNKADNVTFQDCVAAGNKIGWRHWGTGGVFQNCVGVYSKKRGGTGSSEGLWIATTGQVTVSYSTFAANEASQVYIDGPGQVELIDSTVSTLSSTNPFFDGTPTLTRTATYRPGVGVDPLYVADSSSWRGAPANAFDSATYGLTKGYNSGRVGGPANLPPTLTASATPNSGMPPLTVQFAATADDADGVVVAYFWDFGDGVTSVERNPSHVYAAPGSFVARCMVRDNRGAEASQTFPIEVSLPTTPVPLRIEAGSTTAYTDGLGQTWVADHSYGPGGGIVDRGAIEIANTVDDRLYQTERWGLSSYAILLANGTYEVKLHFAETYPGITAAGQRVFSVSAEGVIPAAWNQIDIFAEAGGRNTALVKSATVRVTDQVLNLGFIAGVDNPLINAIEIIPTANQGPDLTISSSTTNGATPLTVAFTATATDADGAVASYNWNFGDGTSSTAQNPSHTYVTAGNFTATCAATDNAGAYSAKSVVIVVAGPAPTGLTATRGTSSDITLAWDASNGATSYRVKRATTSGGPYSLITTVTTPSYRDTGLVPGQAYYYVVSSLNGADESANSAEASAVARNAVTIVDDADATGVTITGEWTTATTTSGYYGTGYKADLNTGTTIAKSVRFTPTLLNAGDYQVFMRWTAGTNRGSNVPVDIIHAAGTTTVTVNQRLTGNQWMPLGTFHFEAGTAGSVLLRNNGSNGFVIADAVEFIELEAAPPAAPTDLVATGGIGQISLAWSGSIGATSYNVKRATSASGPYATIASGLTAATYVDNAATGGSTYYYVVTAQNAYGESPASLSATAASQLGSVIVDNTDTDKTIIVGEWITATTASGYYGANYIQDNNTGATGGKSVTYIPTLTGGTYVVSVRYTSGTNRASNVSIEIQSLTGSTTVTLSEKAGGGVFTPIGTFDFAPGTAGRVIIKNNGANGFVIADAVQFSQVALPAAHAPVITSPMTATGILGQPFSYTITADIGVSAYAATGLPAGLTLNATTGVISGTPTASGSFTVGLSAANTAGTGTGSLTLMVAVPQTITFPNPGTQTYGAAPLTLTASASSGLPVTYSLISGPAEISGSTVTITGAGTVVIAANQAGGGTFAPAAEVQVSFTVAKAAQTIAFPNPGAKTYGAAPFALTATASSGLPVSYSVVSGPAQVLGSILTVTGAGSIEVEANQSGDDNRAAADPVRASFTVAAASAAITLGDLNQTYDGLPKPVTTATTPTGLTVNITYNGSDHAPIFPGSYAVVATLADSNYTGSASGTLVISASVIVRHAPSINGAVTGSVHALLPESFALNSSTSISGDLLVPGTPAVVINGHPTISATLDSGGTAAPTTATLTINSGASLHYLVRQIDPVDLPVVATPAAPAGTQSVSINNVSQVVANFAVVRNLTLNANGAVVAVPAGVYGNLTANGTSHFVLGVAGATEPAVYELQQLQLGGSATIDVVGPVILRLASAVQVNGTINASGDPLNLTVEVASGGLTVNGSGVLRGSVIAPQGTVTVNGTLEGAQVRADRLIVNGSAHLLTDLD